jgi:transcriptional regulator with XRE-family HTH domain
MCYLTGNGGIFEMISGRFKDRLKIAIGERSVNSFAKECEAAEGAIRNYLKGQTTPNLDMLTKISEVSGYSLAWLASGEGELKRRDEYAFLPKPGDPSVPLESLQNHLLLHKGKTTSALDLALMEHIIIEVIRYNFEGDQEQTSPLMDMMSLQTSSTIINTYKVFKDSSGLPPSRESIRAFIKAAVNISLRKKCRDGE